MSSHCPALLPELPVEVAVLLRYGGLLYFDKVAFLLRDAGFFTPKNALAFLTNLPVRFKGCFSKSLYRGQLQTNIFSDYVKIYESVVTIG